ncbi:MAG TPA: AI-2E family transporter [Candidatus Obscuribacterales bacterium]
MGDRDHQGEEQLKSAEKLARLTILQKQLTVAVLALAVFYLLTQVSIFFADILRILGISLLLAYLFIGVVDWLSRYVRSRALSIFLVYVFLAAITIIGAILVLPAMVYQITQLVNSVFEQIPQIIDWLVKAVQPLEQRLHAAKIDVKAMDILSTFAANLPKPDANQILSRMSDVAMSTMTWTMYGLSVLVVSFYFLLDGHHIRDQIISLFPKKHQPRLSLMSEQVDASLQAFFRGQIVLGLCFGALMFFVYFFLGVNYALLLGVVLGVWEIVPVIGPPIGFLPALIVVAIDGMSNVPLNRLSQIIILFLVFNGLQWLKDNLAAPRYIGNVIGLHPVTIFLAIMIGARIDGMLGIIFSLPAACVVNVMITNLLANDSAQPAAAPVEPASVERVKGSAELGDNNDQSPSGEPKEHSSSADQVA